MNIPAAIDLLLECRRTDDRYDLLRHTKKLLELYQKSGQQALRTWSPQRTLELCISLLKEEMDRSSERKMYRHTIAHLSNLHQYPDGPTAAHKLAQYWFAYHNNRPAMKDELRKAGYGEKK